MRVITRADFMPFDWESVASSHRRRLPHLVQPGAICFVTFRLADSVPMEVSQRWTVDRAAWLHAHPPPWTAEEEKEHHRRFRVRLERWLDQGHGGCALARPECRQEVMACLLHDHGTRYDLGDVVVMPNHVHLLLQPLVEESASSLLGPAKGVSARRINQRLGQRGALWMDESFDHIVRGMDSLERFQRYINRNPVRAGLPADAFHHEQRWLVKRE
ncbi:MAG: transposase [Prosthecobacter sp.]